MPWREKIILRNFYVDPLPFTHSLPSVQQIMNNRRERQSPYWPYPTPSIIPSCEASSENRLIAYTANIRHRMSTPWKMLATMSIWRVASIILNSPSLYRLYA